MHVYVHAMNINRLYYVHVYSLHFTNEILMRIINFTGQGHTKSVSQDTVNCSPKVAKVLDIHCTCILYSRHLIFRLGRRQVKQWAIIFLLFLTTKVVCVQ